MRATLARLGSWGRKALVLGLLIAAPVLTTAPAAEAQVPPAVFMGTGSPAQAVPVQYGPPGRYYRGRGHYRGRDHWRGPPPRGYYGRPYARRDYGPPRRFAGPPPPRYYRYS